MSTTAVVWLVVALVSIVAILAMLIALTRHLLVLFRTLGRFQEEVGGAAAETAEASRRAASRADHLRPRA